MFRILIVLATILMSQPAAALDNVITVCLEEHSADEHVCNGQWVKQCVGRADNLTNQDMAECHHLEAAAWEGVLQEALGVALSNSLDESLKTQLEESQRHWLDYRESECRYRSARWGNGSGRVTDSALCYRDLTAQRALLLREHARWPGN